MKKRRRMAQVPLDFPETTSETIERRAYTAASVELWALSYSSEVGDVVRGIMIHRREADVPDEHRNAWISGVERALRERLADR